MYENTFKYPKFWTLCWTPLTQSVVNNCKLTIKRELLACSPRTFVGCLKVLWLPPTDQRLACIWLISNSKLIVGVNVSENKCLYAPC